MIRKENKIIWCSGCGLYGVFNQIVNFIKQGVLKNPVAVSGIGCAGRSAGYFNFDSVNSLHGRAIPIAEGLKQANKNLDVFIFSGDGDLLSIGLNHLIHCSRRNTDIKVFCANNQVYGMTGGQASPTTEKGEITKTSPKGMEFESIDIQKILMANENYFYARTNPFNQKHLNLCIEEAFKHKGFAFVEIKMACITELLRAGKIKSPAEAIKMIKQGNYVKENRELKKGEYGINKK